MKLLQNKFVWIGVVLSFVVGGGIAIANPSYFSIGVTTATATTSPIYMSGGKATTTLTYDSQINTASQQSPYLTNKATLLFQLAATATAPTLNVDLEYSQDGIDWYEGNTSTFLSSIGASTTPTLGTVQSLQFIFASSTVGRPAFTSNGAISTSTRAIVLDVPTRFLRAVFWMSPGSGQGALWAQLVPVKEVHE